MMSFPVTSITHDYLPFLGGLKYILEKYILAVSSPDWAL